MTSAAHDIRRSYGRVNSGHGRAVVAATSASPSIDPRSIDASVDMLKIMTAVAAAALCSSIIAGALVGLTAGRTGGDSLPVAPALTVAAVAAAPCLQTWPYYEESCLRGLPAAARSVRVIAIDR